MARMSKRSKAKSKFTVKETKLSTIFGASLGVISACTVLLLVCLTFARGGEASISYAFAGLLASVFSIIGVVLSILCILDHYQRHFLGWLGIVTNGITLLSMAGILCLGML